MTLMVSIDPGLRGSGVAIWHVGHKDALRSASYVLRDGVASRLPEGIDLLVIEKPKVYQTRHQKGDQRDIIDLAIYVGELKASSGARTTVLVEPWEWKGQVPKLVMARRVLDLLDASERARIALPARSLTHNVLDAIGIGLRHIGRM